VITEFEVLMGVSGVLFTSGFVCASVGNMENEKPLITIGLYFILFSTMAAFAAWRMV